MRSAKVKCLCLCELSSEQESLKSVRHSAWAVCLPCQCLPSEWHLKRAPSVPLNTSLHTVLYVQGTQLNTIFFFFIFLWFAEAEWTISSAEGQWQNLTADRPKIQPNVLLKGGHCGMVTMKLGLVQYNSSPIPDVSMFESPLVSQRLFFLFSHQNITEWFNYCPLWTCPSTHVNGTFGSDSARW